MSELPIEKRYDERLQQWVEFVPVDAAQQVLADRDATIRQQQEKIAELEISANEHWRHFLDCRGVENACSACSGLGARVYGDTSTWHHGIGGQMMTSGVCDKCWGSGDENKHWTNLRRQAERIRQLEDAVREALGTTDTQKEQLNDDHTSL
jgi:excinuclease UvrABC ATPase subunit